MERTVEKLTEINKEKWVIVEREVDKRAKIGADMDEDGLSYGDNETSYDSQRDM